MGAEVVFERGAAGDLGVVGHVERGESVEENGKEIFFYCYAEGSYD